MDNWLIKLRWWNWRWWNWLSRPWHTKKRL